MQQHRIISLASILVMLLIPVIGWFLVAQPQLAAAATADTQRTDMQTQIDASTALVAQLKKDSKNLPELNDKLDKLRASIPADVDSSSYIDGLDALAGASGVSLTSLTVEDPSAYVPATPPAAPAAAAPAATGTDGAAATDPPATPPVVADPAIVTSPLITAANFVTIPVTLEVQGGWDAILTFVKGLQSGDRLFLVSSIGTTRDPATDVLTAKIGGYIYAIPTGLPGDPHPTSTIVKVMSTGGPVPTTDTTEGDGTAPTPDPSATTKP